MESELNILCFHGIDNDSAEVLKNSKLINQLQEVLNLTCFYPVYHSAPNKTNKKMKSTETPIGIPKIASWSNH